MKLRLHFWFLSQEQIGQRVSLFAFGLSLLSLSFPISLTRSKLLIFALFPLYYPGIVSKHWLTGEYSSGLNLSRFVRIVISVGTLVSHNFKYKRNMILIIIYEDMVEARIQVWRDLGSV